MGSLYVLRNAFKGAFILVQTNIQYVDGEDLENIREWVNSDHPSCDDINNKPDLQATLFKKINDEHEYVFVFEPGDHLALSGWADINDLLSEDDPYNYVITTSHISLKRIKKMLLPFL